MSGALAASLAKGRDPLPAIVDWAERNERVLAVILNGSRARSAAVIDEFSDTDVALVVEDVEAFRTDHEWHKAFGDELVGFPNDGTFEGHAVHNRLVLYSDGVKVDFLCWPAAIIQVLAGRGTLPPVLDQGYRVLLDRAGLCAALPAASEQPFTVVKPTEAEFADLVNEFWWETTYVVKSLARQDVFHASYNVDVVMKLRVLRRMLDWRIAAASGWTHQSMLLGRRMREHLDAATWAELVESYAGVTWETLWRTCALFSRAARDVAQAVGYPYPEALEDGVRSYLASIQDRTASDRPNSPLP